MVRILLGFFLSFIFVSNLYAGVTVTLTSGDLWIVGDNNDNVVEITGENDYVWVNVEGQGPYGPYNLDDDDPTINVVLLGGDDTLEYMSSDTVDAADQMEFVVDGGAGDDDILTGDWNDTINGKGGEDVIYSRGGVDTVNAGNDNDTVFSGSGPDDCTDSGGANDILWTGTGYDRTMSGFEEVHTNSGPD